MIYIVQYKIITIQYGKNSGFFYLSKIWHGSPVAASLKKPLLLIDDHVALRIKGIRPYFVRIKIWIHFFKVAEILKPLAEQS